MAKITSTPVSSGYNVTINENFSRIDDELNNKVLYRTNPTGEPNFMSNDMDMNDNDVLNIGLLDAAQLTLNGNIIVASDDLTAGVPATAVSYDNTSSGLTAVEVQGAIDEVEAALVSEASEVNYDNSTSGLTASNVQGAIDEVEGRVDTAETDITALEGRADTLEGQTLTHARIEDQKSSGVNGGTFTSGSFQTRDLNTEVYDPDSIVTLSSNQFTLGAGTYIISWSCPAFNVDRHKSRLYNITDAQVDGEGTSEYTAPADDAVTKSMGTARVVLSGSTVYEIRHRCQTTASTTGFGINSGYAAEVYTTVDITKVG